MALVRSKPGMRVVDLGCGTGRLTRTLHERLAARERVGIDRSDAYARLLDRVGFADPKVQLIVYPHVLATREDVVEWVKGTMLTECERHLPDDVYDRFVDQYRRRLLAQLDEARPFFYPFKRILCWGQRA